MRLGAVNRCSQPLQSIPTKDMNMSSAISELAAQMNDSDVERVRSASAMCGSVCATRAGLGRRRNVRTWWPNC